MRFDGISRKCKNIIHCLYAIEKYHLCDATKENLLLHMCDFKIKFALEMGECFNPSRWFGSSDLFMLGRHFSKAVITIGIIFIIPVK